MKFRPVKFETIVRLIIAASCVQAASAEHIISEDLKVQGAITVDDSSNPPLLYLKGAAASGASGGDVGLSLSYWDATTGVLIQRMNRQQAEWYWQVAPTSAGSDRLMMKLGNDHALTLFDPANPTNEIVLNPGGLQPGVSVNGEKLATLNAVAGSYLPIVPGGLTVTGTGLVGIGTVTPSKALSVAGEAIIGRADNSAAVAITNVGGNFWPGETRFATQGTGQFLSFADGDGSFDALIVRNHKVGIGIPNPLEALSIGANGGGIMFTFDTSSNYRNSIINRFEGAVPAGNRIDFRVSDGSVDGQTQVMTLNGAGYVGVGTTTVGANFHVKQAAGDNTTPFLRVERSDNTTAQTVNALEYVIPGNQLSWYVDSYGIERTNGITIGDPERTIFSGYSAGLGVVDKYGTGVAEFRSTFESDDRAMVAFRSNTSGPLYLGAWSKLSKHGFAFYNGLGEADAPMMVINENANGGNGNVGIGTATPTAKLHVNGDARVDGRIRVAPQGDISMGDFVSEPAP